MGLFLEVNSSAGRPSPVEATDLIVDSSFHEREKGDVSHLDWVMSGQLPNTPN